MAVKINRECVAPTIRQLQRDAYAIAKAKGWHDDDDLSPRQILAWLALVMSELAEAVEEVRRPSPPDPDGKPVGFASELADVVIRVGDMAEAMAIDLEAAVVEKMAYNRTRPLRHGGRIL